MRTAAGRPSTVPVVTYTLVDVFAGCGGMTQGFVQTGKFEPIAAVESDPAAAATYGVNFGEDHVLNMAVEDVQELPAAAVVVGGPPCQGFSPLNRARHVVESRGLWAEYVRVLEMVQPEIFVMENVPQLLKSKEFAAFRALAELGGYEVSDRILNSADFGVPQRRRRAFVVGSRIGAVPWPSETHAAPGKSQDGLASWVTFREAVRDLPLKPDGADWHRSRNSRPETLRRYAAVPQDGGNRFQMQDALDADGLGHLVPPCWRRKPSGTGDAGGRLWWDEPSTTIRCEFYKPEKGRYLHPSEDRPITVREAARLMSFPDDFVLPEGQALTAVGRQIGNAVPPLLARAVAASIASALDRSAPSAPEAVMSGDHARPRVRVPAFA